MFVKSIFFVWDINLTDTAFAWVQILQRVCLAEPWDPDVHTWWGRGGMCGPIVDEPLHTHRNTSRIRPFSVLHQWLTRHIHKSILLPRAMVHFLFLSATALPPCRLCVLPTSFYYYFGSLAEVNFYKEMSAMQLFLEETNLW